MSDAHTTAVPKAERADKARNRARILEVASLAFAESGTETQMDEIAARAGLGVGTLYRHFATKEALMGAMLRRKFSQILAIVQATSERDGDPLELFKDALRGGAEVASADAAAQDALMRAGIDPWEHAADILHEIQATIQRLIDNAQAAGTLRPDLTAADVPMLMCGVSATMAYSDWDWHRHLEILLDGLAVRPNSA
jgi:AcrR family transcriptional regulator